MRTHFGFIVAAVGLLAWAAPATAAEIVHHEVESAFADVAQGLSDAIVNRGYVVDYTAHIGTMLNRTAADVGASKELYKDAQAMQFCSATLSRKAMEADPLNIAHCPYVVFAYELADTPGKVVVGFRKLEAGGSAESKEAIGAINTVLEEIVAEAAGVD